MNLLSSKLISIHFDARFSSDNVEQISHNHSAITSSSISHVGIYSSIHNPTKAHYVKQRNRQKPNLSSISIKKTSQHSPTTPAISVDSLKATRSLPVVDGNRASLSSISFPCFAQPMASNDIKSTSKDVYLVSHNKHHTFRRFLFTSICMIIFILVMGLIILLIVILS